MISGFTIWIKQITSFITHPHTPNGRSPQAMKDTKRTSSKTAHLLFENEQYFIISYALGAHNQ